MIFQPRLSPQHIAAGRPVLLFTLVVVLLIALALIAGGVWLVYLGAKGATEMTVFGNSVKTQSVGVVGLFAGLVLGGLGVQRTLKALTDLGRLP